MCAQPTSSNTSTEGCCEAPNEIEFALVICEWCCAWTAEVPMDEVWPNCCAFRTWIVKKKFSRVVESFRRTCCSFVSNGGLGRCDPKCKTIVIAYRSQVWVHDSNQCKESAHGWLCIVDATIARTNDDEQNTTLCRTRCCSNTVSQQNPVPFFS